MPGTPTTRFAIPTLAGTDLARDIDTLVNSSLSSVDSKMTGWSTGLLSARPTSTGGSPGVAGRIYRATDTGQVFLDTGTGWVQVWPNADAAVTSRMLAPTIVTAENGALSQALSTTAADVTGSVLNITTAVVSTVVLQGWVTLASSAGVSTEILARQDTTDDTISHLYVHPVGSPNASSLLLPIFKVWTGVTAAAHTFRLRARNGGSLSTINAFRIAATVYAQ